MSQPLVQNNMRPLKASLLFLYSLASLTVIGFTVSHLWQTSHELKTEYKRMSAPGAPVAAAPIVATAL